MMESNQQPSSPDEFYEAIGHELMAKIGEPFTSVSVEATMYESSINLCVVYTRPNGTHESDIPDLGLLPEYFYDLADAISTKEKGLYKTCTFLLTADGNFNVNFVY